MIATNRHKISCIALAIGILAIGMPTMISAADAEDKAANKGERTKVEVRKTKVREIKMEGDPVQELEKSESHQLCIGIRDAARERRYALKTKELNALRAQVENRIKALEVRRSELEEWTEKRTKFLKLAEGNLVEIYSKMRPDAAAGRLEILSKPLAAAILMKLSPRKAGVILNEMKAENAAEITQVIANSADVGKKT